MAVLPIDVQTLIAQMNEVARIQHNVQESDHINQQQKAAEFQRNARLDQSRVHDVNQTEDENLKVDEKGRGGEKGQFQGEEKEGEKKGIESPKRNILGDPFKGKLIDVKR